MTMSSLATEAFYQTEAYEEGYTLGKQEGFAAGLKFAIDKGIAKLLDLQVEGRQHQRNNHKKG